MQFSKNVHETISCHCVSHTVVIEVAFNTLLALHVWQLWNGQGIVDTLSNTRISLGFLANSLRFCVASAFVWSQICFTCSFKFPVSLNISSGLAFSGMFNNTFASSVHLFALANLEVSLHLNSGTFLLSSLSQGSSKFKTLTSIRTVASGVRSWWFSSLLSIIGSSAMYSVSESCKKFSLSLSVLFQFCQAF